MSSALFLAVCLHQLNEEDDLSFPLAHNLLTTSTYVNDIIAGFNSMKDILQLKDEIVALLQRGHFNLKKWASNCLAVLENIDVVDRSINSIFEAKDNHSVTEIEFTYVSNIKK